MVLSKITAHLNDSRWLVLGAIIVAVLAVSLLAEARPGGGQSYSGKSSPSGGSSGRSSPSGGSGSSDDGGGQLLFFLIMLVFEHPAIGIPVLLVVVAFFVMTKLKEGWHQSSWSSSSRFRREMLAGDEEIDRAQAPPRGRSRGDRPPVSPREVLEGLRRTDPTFSLVLFEDFLYALYAEAHSARGVGKLDRLAPYLSDAARAELRRYPALEVKSIVVGTMKLSDATINAGASRVDATVLFESNYTETEGEGREQSYYSVERWALTRSLHARSRSPEKSRVFGCPNCGAPLETIRGRICSYCNKVIDTGEFDWIVSALTVTTRETRGPMLTGTAPEEGTLAPTLVAPDAREKYHAISQKDPALSWPAFTARVELIFNAFQAAWSSQDLRGVRPYLSDNLFQTQLYWIDTYTKAGLRNITENARIVTIHLARVVSDSYYDAITVRVFATGLDYTLDARGDVVGGSRSREREYSEYWTLIRGSDRTGAPRTDPVCPNCGASLRINMTGHCEYCRAKVTAGDFDWVLSRIEQDEAYG